MKIKYIFILSCFFTIVSCNNQNKSNYRIVGKNGDVIYFDKRRPEFNIEQLKQQKEEKLDDQKKDFSKDNKKAKIVKDEKKTSKEELKEIEKQKLRNDSSAYTLRTVMDNVLKSENINELAKEIEGSKTISKTIKNFEYIPDLYFENISEDKKLTVSQNNDFVKKTRQNINTFDKIEDIKKEVSSAGLIKNKYYVQLGSFATKEKANNILKKNDFGKEAKVIEIKKNNKTLYRTVLGSYSTKSEADFVKQKVIENGHFDVIVFKY